MTNPLHRDGSGGNEPWVSVASTVGAQEDADRLERVLHPLEVKLGKEHIPQIIRDRLEALTHVHSTLSMIRNDLYDYFSKVPETLPTQIHGQLLNPDGSPAQSVSVEAEEPVYTPDEHGDAISWPMPRDITDNRGAFGLKLPTVPIPLHGMRLRVRGSDSVTEIVLRRADLVGGRSNLGVLPLDRPVKPLPSSILSQLKGIIPTSAGDVTDHPEQFADPAPVVTLGEGDCAHSFRSNTGVIDLFGYSVLIRLIEPQVSPKQIVMRATERQDVVEPNRPAYTTLPVRGFAGSLANGLDPDAYINHLNGLGQWYFADRIPVDGPIDIAKFRRGLEEYPASVPKAASLGLGYIVKIHQTWIPVGLSLGDLLYSLPLAPGEQQRVAVFEQVQTMSVRESESLSLDEAQRFQERADSTTQAVFNSAFNEAARGGSSMHTESSSSSWGVVGGVGGFFSGVLFGVGAGGGSASASSSGSINTWQNVSRDYTSYAAQQFHAALSRTGSASRRSTRSSVRLASATDDERMTTKVITNHNHCHALTIQFWEVLRHFAVSSHVDDVQLVCFIPLEVIQFLPFGQPRALPTGAYDRNYLLGRYDMLIRYHDVLTFELQRRPEYTHGLRLLKNFASDPTATAQSSTGTHQDVVSFYVTGTFLPFEDAYVSLITKSGARVGPVKLIATQRDWGLKDIPASTYTTLTELLEELHKRRNSDNGDTLRAQLVLPDYIARNDVARFELTRSFRPFSYKLKVDIPPAASTSDILVLLTQSSVRLSASQLEQELGGPFVWDVKASLSQPQPPALPGLPPPGVPAPISYVDSFHGRAAAERMSGLLPIPTLRVPPVLSFADLLRIESVFQHVLQNAVTYSKSIWRSLTPEERAIMLERYTIGVPGSGVTDASQEVPLLNAVANEVLGYYGNSMIMPFSIPPQLAQKMEVTSRDVQDALLKFHRQAFAPLRSSITLPAHGMLGEAVLGGCNSCEKIDLTRFWNWQDSASDAADTTLKPSDFKGMSLIGQGQGATAPNNLSATQPVNMLSISTGEKAPAPSSNLLEQMLSKAPQLTTEKDFTGLTALQTQLGSTLSTAEAARKDALATAKTMAEKVLDKLPDVLSTETKVKEAEEKQKTADKEAERKKKATTIKEGIDKLNTNASSFIGVAGAKNDDDTALSWANSVVAALFGDYPLPNVDVATLFDKFKIVSDKDDVATQRGKKAFLTALGLPTSSRQGE